MSISETIKVKTDEAGCFTHSRVINPPGFWPINVAVKVKLISPPTVNVSGNVNLQPAGTTTKFALLSGAPVDLGVWRLDGGDNTITVHGCTSPALPNNNVEIEITASL